MENWKTEWTEVKGSKETHGIAVKWGVAIMPRWSYLLRKTLEEEADIVEISNAETHETLIVLSDSGLNELLSILKEALESEGE